MLLLHPIPRAQWVWSTPWEFWCCPRAYGQHKKLPLGRSNQWALVMGCNNLPFINNDCQKITKVAQYCSPGCQSTRPAIYEYYAPLMIAGFKRFYDTINYTKDKGGITKYMNCVSPCSCSVYSVILHHGEDTLKALSLSTPSYILHLLKCLLHLHTLYWPYDPMAPHPAVIWCPSHTWNKREMFLVTWNPDFMRVQHNFSSRMLRGGWTREWMLIIVRRVFVWLLFIFLATTKKCP